MQNIHPFFSLLPPLVAIAIALIFRQVILALFLGILAGTLLLKGISSDSLFGLEALFSVVDTYLIKALSNHENLSILLFTLMIGGMVSLITKNGGMYGVVNLISKKIKNRFSAQLSVWFMGICIFFDDYANTLVVGSTMRTVTDKFKVSREKLAYIVDTTAAPMAAIAFISTWVGTELGYLQAENEHLELGSSAIALFFKSIPFSFYPIFALAFIVLLIVQKKEFGPMLKAEQRAIKGEPYNHDEAHLKPEKPIEKGVKRPFNAIIPVLVLVLVTMIGIAYTGLQKTDLTGLSFAEGLSKVMKNAESTRCLLWGSLSGLITSLILTVSQRLLSIEHSIETVIRGFEKILPAILILVFAWTLKEVMDELGTKEYLGGVIKSSGMSATFLPILTFLLAAVISFATGTSWGTMHILFPLILPLSWELAQKGGYEFNDAMTIFSHAAASVLAGSVFGDHCSPISDTTIMSSTASGCKHIDHVRTQLPYAVCVASCGLIVSLVWALFLTPWYFNLPLGIALCYIAIKYLGTKVD